MTMPFLVGDIGGTNIRLALARPSARGIILSHAEESRVAAQDGLAAAIGAYLERAGARAGDLLGASLAIAGPLVGRACVLPNCGWEVDADALERSAGLPSVSLLNDFHAAALGTLSLLPEALVRLGGEADPDPRGTRVVVGPGTGLGVALLAWSDDQPVVLSGEGGHTALAARGAGQRALQTWLEHHHGRACWEDVLCGRGLVRLYRFLEERDGPGAPLDPGADEPAQVAGLALDGACVRAQEALHWFVELLGAFLGDLSLLTRPSGGIWLAGGISPKILPALQGASLRRSFVDQGSRSVLLHPLPILLADHPHLGLLGAARAAFDAQG